MNSQTDIIGKAIGDFSSGIKNREIIVHSDRCDTDEIPVHYLFRTIDEMPEIERIALKQCRGSILDIGAGAGCHALYLQSQNMQVTCLDTSAGAIAHLRNNNLEAIHGTIFDIQNRQFDTLLLLMNGIGIAGTMTELPAFLNQLKKLLKPGGRILCDSTDISYLYTEDDGSVWINLNDRYYGEMIFEMEYMGQRGNSFPWLYVDFDNLDNHASRAGLSCTHFAAGENNHYLALLTHV